MKDNRSMEEQTVTVTVRTRGEACELSDGEIAAWYRDRIDRLFDPRIGEHEIFVQVERRPIG